MEAEKLVTEPLQAPQHLKNAEIIVDILVVKILDFYQKLEVEHFHPEQQYEATEVAVEILW